MKNTLLSVICIAMITACGNKKNTDKTNETSMSTEDMHTDEVVAVAPEFQKGYDLIEKSDCLSCHKVNEKVVGPSYEDVAAKYTVADLDMLAKTIIKGGSGHWGEIPMTPHTDLLEADAKEMVKYILSLKKAEAN
jgi:cytochrome c